MNTTEAIKAIHDGRRQIETERQAAADKARKDAEKTLPKLWKYLVAGTADVDALRAIGRLLPDLPAEKQAEIEADFGVLKRADRFQTAIDNAARAAADIAELQAGPAAANLAAGIDCAELRKFKVLTLQLHAIKSGTPGRQLAELQKSRPDLWGKGPRPEPKPEPKAAATMFAREGDDDPALARQELDTEIAEQQAIVERTTPQLAEVTSRWKAETDRDKRLLLGRERGDLVVECSVAEIRLTELETELAAGSLSRPFTVG